MKKIRDILFRLDDFRGLQCIRSALVIAIPVLLVGSAMLVLRSFPIDAYQSFITRFANGIIYDILSYVYNATFGMLAVYLTGFISISYAAEFSHKRKFGYGTMLASFISFSVFNGVGTANFEFSSFGVKGMFTAVVSALFASALYTLISERVTLRVKLYSDGADSEFKNAVNMVLPLAITVTVFAVLNYLITVFTGANNFQHFFINSANSIFGNMGAGLGSALLFTLLSSVLWFFGIHGSDVLDNVSEHLFVPAIEANHAIIESGGEATEIFSKTFFDVFVLMGGCGSALCLLIALLAFSKQRSNRSLGRLSALPMLFNINEIMVFGLPIVFNLIMLIPFILTPIIVLLISYSAMSVGLVPVVVTNVEWTTPVFFSGYMATGSLAGALLQLVNLTVGVAVYLPFVRLFDKEKQRGSAMRVRMLVERLKKSEENNESISFLHMPDSCGMEARMIVSDLEKYLKGAPDLQYQPQYNSKGDCVGVEALLRWKHPVHGMMYPPLVIKLASESDNLEALEKAIFCKVASDIPEILRRVGENTVVSVNISAASIQTAGIENFLMSLPEKYNIKASSVCIEVTEQMTISFTPAVIECFKRLRAFGYQMAIDDFSMGNTSLKYLQENLFDIVKLDGSLVRDMMENERSEKIIATMVKLSHELNLKVLAEYVETPEQKNKLEALGCLLYQGWLYSPAVEIEKLRQQKKLK